MDSIKTIHTSTDGVHDTATLLGEPFADGSTVPDDWEVSTDALMSGLQLSAGANGAYVLRVHGVSDVNLATLQTANEAGTDRYFHFVNPAGTKAYILGPAKVTAAHKRPPGGTRRRESVIIAFNVAGDFPSDFFTEEEITA